MPSRAGIERELASRADQRVLRCFGHVERMDEYRMDRMVLTAGVSGGRVRGKPRLGWIDGWMDGVKMALGDKGMTVYGGCASMCERSERVERPGTYVTEFVARGHFCLVLCSFRTTLPCSGGYHLERGGMPLHDAVGINCKKGATTEYQGADVKYMG